MTTFVYDLVEAEFIRLWREGVDRNELYSVVGPVARLVVTNEEFNECVDDFINEL
jgi:hypothetical protein